MFPPAVTTRMTRGNTMTDTNRLRVLRAERRMTQFTLASLTRTHPSRIWKIENGYIVPNLLERRSIASALGVQESDVWPSSSDSKTESKAS